MRTSESIAKFFGVKYDKPSFEELCEVPISAINGVGESDVADLKKAFGVDIIKGLAENKYVTIARFVKALMSLAKLLGISKFCIEPPRHLALIHHQFPSFLCSSTY